MYRRLKALKDTYLTDKIVNDVRRTKTNLGKASTIDIFKLYGINVSASLDQVELSRGLIKFDLDPIRALTGSILDLDHSSFKAEINLIDVYGGQPTPNNFTLVAVPVSRAWDEGAGSDVVMYNEIDACNFLTASYTSAATTLWHLSGANKGGLLGSADLDIILSGNLLDGNGIIDLAVSQTFVTGEEDLRMDVTSIVSATLVGTLPDHGFRISYVEGEEIDGTTRFVKRFATRHAHDHIVHPKLLVKYDDVIQDNQLNSQFDLNNTVFLYNYDRDGLANLTSGSSDTIISGSNSLVMKLMTDSPAILPSGGIYNLVTTASSHIVGGTSQTGMYSASFIIRSSDSELSARLALSSSIEFTQIWGSLDGTVGYLTQSLFTISKQDRRTSYRELRDHIVNVTNAKSSYNLVDKVKFRLFAQSLDDENVIAKKLPFKRKSVIFNNAYYQIRDAYTNDVVIPFVTESSATRLSTDSEGMYFDFYMSDAQSNRVYEIDIMVRDAGTEQIFRNVATKFRIEPYK